MKLISPEILKALYDNDSLLRRFQAIFHEFDFLIDLCGIEFRKVSGGKDSWRVNRFFDNEGNDIDFNWEIRFNSLEEAIGSLEIFVNCKYFFQDFPQQFPDSAWVEIDQLFLCNLNREMHSFIFSTIDLAEKIEWIVCCDGGGDPVIIYPDVDYGKIINVFGKIANA